MVSEEAVVEYLSRFDDIAERVEKGWQIFERGEKIFQLSPLACRTIW